MGLVLGCGPAPSEVLDGHEASAGSSTSVTSTSGEATRGTSGSPGSGVEGSAGSMGVDADATASDGTTEGVQLGTSTGDTLSGTSGPGSTSTGDEAGSSSTGPSPSCNELYDQAPGYLLCMETETECHFNANTNGGDCNMMCAAYLGKCIDAFDNSSGCSIIRPDMDDCDTNRGTEICVCSK